MNNGREENSRFGKGQIKIIVHLNKDKWNTKKSKNYYKILKRVIKLGVNLRDVLMIGHASAEIKFDDYKKANLCLNAIEKDGEGLSTTVDRRSLSCSEVITDWDHPIEDLWETFDDTNDIIVIERMYRKKCIKEEKKLIDESTENIIVTFK